MEFVTASLIGFLPVVSGLFPGCFVSIRRVDLLLWLVVRRDDLTI
jgi:hypothetical protein